MDERVIFERALDFDDPGKRADYLDEVCGENVELRAGVEALLRSHEQAGSFLQGNAAASGVSTTVDGLSAEEPGSVIGPYKLLQKLGEGGMGTVWMAEQQHPVRRKVALKLIKPGMDSKQVLARFEAERQALALMDHPNIAKVLEAGTTDSGRPFFVMELVKGLPLTHYCDQQRLSTQERLELFVAVCQAIQHAHQKGIIHRDLKPSNVLVASYDGRPVVKVIDFGVAKAIGQQLTERTLFTGFGSIVGTLEYMSPEQAEFNALDVDTRSDIYSLGVILYELLTGCTPLSREWLKSNAINQVLQAIREQDPPRPSVRLSESRSTLETISAARKSEPSRLTRLVRGDLDWIVMKALNKERGRRYGTASSLAGDVQRYLQGEAIEARPPSVTYQLGKLASRNRVALAAATAVTLALFAGLVAFIWGYTERTEALRKLHDLIIERVVLKALSGESKGAKEALNLAEQAGVSDEVLRSLEGIVLFHRGENEKAIRRLEALTSDERNVLARATLATAYVHAGEWDKFLHEASELERLLKQRELRDHELLACGTALIYIKPEESVEMLESVVDRHPTWVSARAALGNAMAHFAVHTGRSDLAQSALSETQLARELVKGNRVILMHDLWAHTVAINLGLSGSFEGDLRETAGELANELALDRDYTVGNLARAWYFDVVDEPDAAQRAYETQTIADRGTWTYNHIAYLVHCGQQEKAIRIVSRLQTRSPYAMLAKASLFAGIPESRGEARRLYNQIVKESKSKETRWNAVRILLLLGDLDTARNDGEQLLLSSKPEELDRSWWPSRTGCEFLCGRLSQADFQRRTCDTPLGRCMYHFQMALMLLAEGEQESAGKHISACVATDQIGFGPHQWARAFQTLLAEDENWPGN